MSIPLSSRCAAKEWRLFRARNKRHAYATHQLEAGLPVHQLLGHQNLQSTLRYVHWVPGYQEGQSGIDLIAALEVKHGGQ
jgi:integrase